MSPDRVFGIAKKQRWKNWQVELVILFVAGPVYLADLLDLRRRHVCPIEDPITVYWRDGGPRVPVRRPDHLRGPAPPRVQSRDGSRAASSRTGRPARKRVCTRSDQSFDASTATTAKRGRLRHAAPALALRKLKERCVNCSRPSTRTTGRSPRTCEADVAGHRWARRSRAPRPRGPPKKAGKAEAKQIRARPASSPRSGRRPSPPARPAPPFAAGRAGDAHAGRKGRSKTRGTVHLVSRGELRGSNP